MSGVDFSEFMVMLRVRVPHFPSGVTAEAEIDSIGLDHVQKAALKHAFLDMAGPVSQEVLSDCKTFADVYNCLSRSATGIGTSSSVVRGQYTSKRVLLRPIEPADYLDIYRASLDPATSYRWRFRGRTPSPEAFQAALFGNVFAQFTVADRENRAMIGICSAHDEHQEAGHCHISFQRCTQGDVGRASGGEMVEGMALFVAYLFRNWPFRKLYAEVPEYNSYLLSGVMGDLVELEARLRDYLYYDGRFWDMLVVVLQRQRWLSFIEGWGLEEASPA